MRRDEKYSFVCALQWGFHTPPSVSVEFAARWTPVFWVGSLIFHLAASLACLAEEKTQATILKYVLGAVIFQAEGLVTMGNLEN